jgi:hypothetical protein
MFANILGYEVPNFIYSKCSSLTKALAYNLQAVSALVKSFMAQASKSLD